MENRNRLSVSFYKDRREALRKIMPPNSIFVRFAAPDIESSNGLYHQNQDMLYFSGYDEPNSIMYIFREDQKIDKVDSSFREVIFTPPNEVSEIIYTGKSMGAEEAMKELGIQLAVETSKYEEFPLDLSKFKVILTDIPPSDVRESNSPYSLSSLISAFRKKAGIQYVPDDFSFWLSNHISEFENDTQHKAFIKQIKAYISRQPDIVTIDPLMTRYLNSTDSLNRILIKDSVVNSRINYVKFNRLTSSLRQIKTEEEIIVVKQAVEITCNAHREVMKATTPEMSERQIQGIHEYIYKLDGAKDIGFPSIIASGINGCILHYQDNDVQRVGNNLVLMDVGAKVCGYSADVTRTIPANGRFSPSNLPSIILFLKLRTLHSHTANPGHHIQNSMCLQ